MSRDSWSRRAYLAAGTIGVAAAGCLGLGGSSPEAGPDVGSVSFEFTYERSPDGPNAVSIEHAAGDGIRAGDLSIRTGDGDRAIWSELGSTVETTDERVTTGSTARIGPTVVNWPSEVRPGERVKVLYVPGENSVTELDRYRPPTPTPTASPTPTPTATPTPKPALVTGFEDGNLDEWTVVDTGSSGAASWTVTTDHPFESERAARYRGDEERILGSTSGLDRYPERGDTFSATWQKTAGFAKTGLSWGVQSPAFARGYRLYTRSHTWENSPDTAFLRVRTGDGFEVLDATEYDVSAYSGRTLRWEVEWGDPTIRVRLVDGSGEEKLSLAGEDERYDAGGVAVEGNASDPATVYVDEVRIE